MEGILCERVPSSPAPPRRSNVTSLKLTVGNVVSDVKEHFRTASNTIAAHNATMIAEIRGSYQEELDHSAKLRQEAHTDPHNEPELNRV